MTTKTTFIADDGSEFSTKLACLNIASIVFFTAFLFASCEELESDSVEAKLRGRNSKYRVEVLSGGQIARTYISTDKVVSAQNSGGYFFVDAVTGKLVEISGDIIITQID